MNRRDWIKGIATTAGATAAALAIPGWAQSDKRIVLGQSAAMTGPAGALGVELNRGARLYFDGLNAAGGINGRNVELRVLDDGYDAARCKANTEKLLKDDVFALFGYVGTGPCAAALPMVTDRQMPFFSPFTGADALRESTAKSVFHLRASYRDETALIVKHLTSLGLTRIAVFHQDDAYGRAGLDGVLRALKPLNLSPVVVGTSAPFSTDVAGAVKTIGAQNAHAVIQIGAYATCAAFIQQSRAAGFGGSFYNLSFVGVQPLAEQLGRAGAGVVVSQVVPSPFSTTKPISREYIEAVTKAGGGTANYVGMEGFVAAKVFGEGLKRTGRTLTRESLMAALETMQNVNLGGFNVNFSARDHVASNFVELSMLTGDGKVRS